MKNWLYVDQITLAALIVLAVIVALGFVQLPDSIPTSFSDNGVPQAYGSKLTLLLEPGFALFAVAITEIATRLKSPSVNLPFLVPPERQELLKPLSDELLRLVRAELVVGFALIEWFTIESARAGHLAPGFTNVIWALSGALPVTVIYYLARIVRVARG